MCRNEQVVSQALNLTMPGISEPGKDKQKSKILWNIYFCRNGELGVRSW